MSYEAVKWALYESPTLLTPAGKPDTVAKFVLVAHCERADKHGKGSYPGPAALVAATGYDERTIDRAEKRLKAEGLLIPRGISHLGTARWDVDMSKVRTDSGQEQAEARIKRRREVDAKRQRSRRERLKAAAENANSTAASIDGDGQPDAIVTDSTSVTSAPTEPDCIEHHPSTGEGVTDAASVMSRTLHPDVTDSASGCHGRSAPQTIQEPPLNHPGTIPGGTLPPDPWRPGDPSGRRTESRNSLTNDGELQPRPDTATHDRVRAENAAENRRRTAPSSDPPNGLARVIPLHPRTA